MGLIRTVLTAVFLIVAFVGGYLLGGLVSDFKATGFAVQEQVIIIKDVPHIQIYKFR